MKIIHTADIHLDSPLTGIADAVMRRAELLRALGNLAEYAHNNKIAAVIVAGDLFDDEFASDKTVESVAQIISGSSAQWFVLRGNHGNAKPYELLRKLCPKVNFFGDGWTSYMLGNVAITGRELGANDVENWQKLTLDRNMYNVLVLHGDVDDAAYGLIDKNAIANCGANYVALGHRHAFCEHKFGKVKGCYSGVLEARGFDETEPTGFVVIDTDSDKVTFCRQQIRCVETRKVDVTDVTTDFALENMILNAVGGVDARNYLNVEFVGALSEGVRLIAAARGVLQDRFFGLRLKDKTTAAYDVVKLQQEVSLRGEFVKLAMVIEDEQQRKKVLELGLAALRGTL